MAARTRSNVSRRVYVTLRTDIPEEHALLDYLNSFPERRRAGYARDMILRGGRAVCAEAIPARLVAQPDHHVSASSRDVPMKNDQAVSAPPIATRPTQDAAKTSPASPVPGAAAISATQLKGTFGGGERI